MTADCLVDTYQEVMGGAPSRVAQHEPRLVGEGHLALDTAFASKVAYFASFDRDRGRGPLIADLNTAWALWALAAIWDSRSRAALYADYVAWAERWAADLNCRPDDVERALFIIGPSIRRIWKQLRRA